MIPALLVRVGIDSTRHNPEHKDLNPCARCDAAVKNVTSLFNEKIGLTDSSLIESATVAAYFAEFFYSAHPATGEAQWKADLVKEAGQLNSFETWQDKFKKKYASLYQDDNVWIALMMTSYAYTHQYELAYTEDAWEFKPAAPYFHMEQVRQLSPHIDTVAEILHHLWQSEVEAYRNLGFDVDEYKLPHLGKVECLGFDTKKYDLVWPPSISKPSTDLDMGELIADIVLPVEQDSGQKPRRLLDSQIFSGNHIDVTALTNRAEYFFKGRRRLYELSVSTDAETARMCAMAEGWHVAQ